MTPRVHTRQPQVFTPALAPGLRHAWTTFGLGGNGPGSLAVFDAGPAQAHGKFGTGSPTTTTGNYHCATPLGSAVKCDNSGTGTVNSVRVDVGDSTGTGAPGGSTFTLMALIWFGATGSQAIYSSNTGNNGIRWGLDGSTKINVTKPGVADMGSSTTALSAGRFYVMGTTYDGATLAFYLNGLQDGTASNTQTFTHAQTSILGDQSGGGNASNDSRFLMMLQFDTVLRATEMRAYADNIWGVFPRPGRVYAKAAAGGGGGLAANPLYGGGAAGNPMWGYVS